MTMVLSLLLCELNGAVLDGPELVFHFWLKLHLNLELDTIKLILLPYQPAFQANKSSLSSLLLTPV
jgi:hypothetical protein